MKWEPIPDYVKALEVVFRRKNKVIGPIYQIMGSIYKVMGSIYKAIGPIFTMSNETIG